MGNTTWSSRTYNNIKTSYSTKSTDDVFTSNRTGKINSDMSPIGVDIRESRDSEEHPTSLAVAVFLDETGSMGRIPEIIAKEKLGNLMQTLIDNGIEHPQILFGGIGDHITDDAPLQIGQFESGTVELDKWLTSLYLEGYGGGQQSESYSLAWLFAGRHTSIDCFEKRNQKGFLFTIGDEDFHRTLERSNLQKIMGHAEADLNSLELLEEAQKTYNVYHIHVQQASYLNSSLILDSWKDALGDNLILLQDYNDICEVIASIVAVKQGIDLNQITSDFSDTTKDTVTTALANITSGELQTKNEIVTL